MFVTGPDVVRTVTHEEVTHEELGGSVTHATRSGVADGVFENDVEALLLMRQFLNFLPLNNRQKPPLLATSDPAERVEWSLDTLVPDSPNKPYDIKELVRKVVDDGSSSSSRPSTRRTSSRASRGCRGRPSASSPTSDGARRLPRHQLLGQGRALRALLRRLQHPDHHLRRRPGFMPGTAQEYGGIIRTAPNCSTPSPSARAKVTVITRKAYGGAYDVMSSKHLRGDVNFAWPTAEIAVMGPKGAVEIIFRKDAADPRSSPSARRSTGRSSRTPSSPAPRLHRRRDPAARHAHADLPLAGDAADKKLEIPGASTGISPVTTMLEDRSCAGCGVLSLRHSAVLPPVRATESSPPRHPFAFPVTSLRRCGW